MPSRKSTLLADSRSPRPGRREFLRKTILIGVAASFREALANEASPLPVPVKTWGKRGSAPGEFASPIALTIGPKDEIFVGDTLNTRIQVFNTEGEWLRSISLPVRPAGVVVDRDGKVHVSNWTRHTILVYSPDGKLVREWGSKGSKPGEFWTPAGLAFGLDGSLYISDTGNSRIQHFSPRGDFLREWGSNGAGPSQFGAGWKPGDRFAGPQFINVDRQGRVYTADSAGFRVQRFSAEGKFERQWQNSSSGPGGFGPPRPPAGPIALCADAQDRIWVGAVNSRVQQFTPSGRYLRCLGDEMGSSPGQFHLPHGMAFDSQGCLYVADTLNFRIQKFAKL